MTVRKYLPLMRAVVSVAALGLLLALYDFKAMFQIIVSMRFAGFVAAVAAFVLTTVLFIFKWNLTLPGSVGFLRAARGYVTSYFYSLLPTGQAGAELGKVMTLANHAGLPLLAGSVIFDKVIGLLALAILGALAWFLSTVAPPWMIALVLIIAAGCVAALAGVPFAPLLLPRPRGATPNAILRLCTKLMQLCRPIVQWVMDPLLLIKVLVLGLAGQACMICIYAIMARALGIDLPIPQLALLVVIANLATLVPISIGGIGVREASLVGLLASEGVRGESAMALSLSVFAVFLLGAAVGAALEFRELANAWKHFVSRRNSAAMDASDGEDS